MTFDRFLALLTFLVAAFPLGAIALVALLYGAVALGRAPDEAATIFERHAGRVYCWAMFGDLVLAILLIKGWTDRLLLLAVAACFLRAVLDLLPKLESMRAGAPLAAPVAAGALTRWRQVIAAVSAAQWVVVLAVYVMLVL